MSTQRDAIMAKYPGVIVIDYERPGDHPLLSGTTKFLVYDKRLPDDPGVTTNQGSFRTTQKANAELGNPNGDTLCGWGAPRTAGNILTTYP